MSHFTEVKTKISNSELLKKTLKEKGFLERIDGTRGYWEIHL